ncbi:MAG: hypothetical protein Q9168_004626 [Polycauliona sp. 1 TL-2023]
MPKRAPSAIPYDIQNRQLKTFSLIIPVQIAAEHTTEFLQTIYGLIEFDGLHGPATSHQIITMWDFELTFYSANSVIPWGFIQDYVADRIDAVQRGFTACYDEVVTGVIGTVAAAAVQISFRLNRPEPPLVLTR